MTKYCSCYHAPDCEREKCIKIITSTHQMKLHDSPFAMIKSGQKTIELRLWDEKRRGIDVGDTIVFTNTADGEKLQAKVLKLHLFDSFEMLYASLPLLKCGYTESDVLSAHHSDMDAYYSVSEQEKYGVVGIELSITSPNKSRKLCDMHTHTCFSDGTLTPEELIAEAEASGIDALALCDHNTVDGLERFMRAAEKSTVVAVPGVEIATEYEGKEVHVLGLFLKESSHKQLTEYFEQYNRRKIEANMLLTRRLCDGGFIIDYEAILKKSGTAVPNRTHFSRELMEKGYASSIAEAFDTILAKDGKFYTPVGKFDTLEAIAFLSSLEAVPVLAHPFLNFTLEKLREFLPKAKMCGLIGMETIYPLFSEEETRLGAELAAEFDLIPSGGSDFHGTNKPDIMLGRGKNNIEVPYEVYENLRSRSKS